VRTQNIKTGFHRLGLVVAMVFAVPGALALVAALPVYLWYTGSNKNAVEEMLLSGVGGPILGACIYGAARAVGWIIAGFVGDNE
jgi:hypothetical protein